MPSFWYNMSMKKGNDMSSVNWVATNAKETTKVLSAELPNDHFLVKENRDILDGVDLLKSLASEDYITWSGLNVDDLGPDWANSEVIKERMAHEYVTKLSHKVGSKYIKILSGGGVWGFIVNTKNDNKFKYGDILKAAGYAAPARNFARGNVITDSVESLRKNSVRWTGVKY